MQRRTKAANVRLLEAEHAMLVELADHECVTAQQAQTLAGHANQAAQKRCLLSRMRTLESPDAALPR